ncbi:tolloid-like protein 1 [Dreissena polymorpha]|nr:tolloid-like protein 1 [Dreissena polymorpha]
MEYHSSCNYDYLHIFNGPSTSYPSIGKFCGTTTPSGFRSQSNSVYFVFKTDYTYTFRGFSLTYLFFTQGFLGEFTNPYGVITSPNYPLDYENYTDCEWAIRAQEGKRIKLDFTSFITENNHDCLEIFNGPSTSYPSIGKFCGSATPSGFRSQSNSVYFVFKTDGSVTNRGFSLTYMFFTQGFLGELTNPYGVITSPNYPGDYESYTDCEWAIRAQEGKRIKLDFTYFKTEDCEDNLEIFNGPSISSPFIGKFCGSATPSGFRSQSNSVYFVFQTDGSVTYRGFSLTYVFFTQVSSVAIGKTAIQTDTANEDWSFLAVDGLSDTCSTTTSINAEWMLDLTEYYLIEEVSIHSSVEAKSYEIEMGLARGKYEAAAILSPSAFSSATWRPTSKGPYRHVRVMAKPQNQPLTICELQIKGSEQPKTPPFRVFTGIAMSNPPLRTVAPVESQIECSSICLRQKIPACVTAQFDQAEKRCALFDGCEHTDSPGNEKKTVVFAVAANCFTK